ncbi:hypothetical protein SDRG_14274 [Saprolegnia diclina VS20]|uniref:Myb-like domain-containing protein n=1 Tax=Saprolegnia diclina (strain VS20) TaxID=1156394 RepID=T0REJ1_SAPDV|nr:hypothetical protein SDRG_14274 [Saprolegnia diclina VS20]EQC28002.1 hypothetical protein SDRG_14274 [Saprolegnia diclina VS20]|eukprot:XP_008618615.1 hypothetical protein SDRG_14274 [Saprolegnia diclina VS20]
MPPTEGPKRRNWTADDDLILLRQVGLAPPFLADEIMPGWGAIATALDECEDFDRVIDGKELQSRFNLLIEKHRNLLTILPTGVSMIFWCILNAIAADSVFMRAQDASHIKPKGEYSIYITHLAKSEADVSHEG